MKNKTEEITIAVSGINAVDNPGPGTGICRSLKESGLKVRTVGLAYDAMEPGIYMNDVVDVSYIMPYPSSDEASFLSRLQYIHSVEKIDVIISCLDAELPVMMDIKDELQKTGIKTLLPEKDVYKLRDKTNLKSLAEKINIKVPEYFPCTSVSDLHSAIQKTGFPCMVKGPFYEAFKVSSVKEATETFNTIAHKWGYPIIVQKFVKGDEYNVVGCGDGKGGDMGVFAMRKMTTTKLGKVWNAISISNKRLIDATRQMVSYLKWAGGFEFEVLMEENTMDIYLLEVNPRFPAWVYMASACGINLPERLVKHLLGKEHETHSDYKSGKLMIRYTAETIRDISDFEKVTTMGTNS